MSVCVETWEPSAEMMLEQWEEMRGSTLLRWMQKTEKPCWLRKQCVSLAEGETWGDLCTSPFVALYPCVFVFPTVALLSPLDVQFLIAVFV